MLTALRVFTSFSLTKNPVRRHDSHPFLSLFFFLFLFFLSFSFFFFCLLGLHLQPMEVPRLGVESELELLAYTTATAMQDPSCVCKLHHSSWQRRILNPLSKAKDQTHNLMVPSQIC